ncbi:MAG: hypothetical protein ABW221_05870 [Vicinamibacteria bacterium]
MAALLLAASTAGAPAAAPVLTPIEHRRTGDQTFLTFPEWFLVYSPDEYASFVKDRPPSEFPFFGHLRQFWSSYWSVYQETRRDYPVNAEYHVMVAVIGSSTTVEYALRSAYENTLGRASEATVAYGTTDEDRLAARVAQDYVDFIRDRPWYEFDFLTPLRTLWRETPAWGAGPLRKWERRYALTSEWVAKAGYAWLIGRGSQAAYGAAETTTAVVLDRLPEGIEGELPRLRVLERLPEGAVLATVPRYDVFKDHAAVVARRGGAFVEVAGNRGPILVTALVPSGWTPPVAGAAVVFTQPILTRPGRQRLAVTVPVGALAELLRVLEREGHALEHVYDY